MDGQARLEECVNRPGAHESLNFCGLGDVVVGHGRESHVRGDLANSFVEHESLHGYVPCTGRYNCGGGRLPVVPPVGDSVEEAVILDKGGVGDGRNSSGQGRLDGSADKVNNCSFEEHSENGGEAGPESSPDVKLNVVSVDIDDHIYGVNHHDLTASGGGDLSLELKAKSDIHGVHVHFDVSISDHQRSDLVAEVVASEFGSKFAAVEGDGVVGSVSSQSHPSETLFNVEGVVIHVILATADVGDGKTINYLDESIEPLISSLSEDGQVD